MRRLLFLICVLILMTGGSTRIFGEEEEMIQLLLATDLHYLSPLLTDYGPLFQRMVESADGKLPERSVEILEALVQETLNSRPDALLLPGDLTFNGERQSLIEVLAQLRRVRDAGIPVLILPGNHDIAYPYARSYFGDKAERTDAISGREFAAACASFGPDQAFDLCPYSFSYVYEFEGVCRLLMLDANTEAMPGGIDQKTLSWAEQALKDARSARLPVISVTHQNVLRQSGLFYQGFVVSNEKEVKDLLMKGQVKTNLSGHSHIQHTASEGDLTDYATGCLSTSPLHYGWIRIDPTGEVCYEARELPVCQEEALERFRVCTSRQVREALSKLEIPEIIREKMIDFAAAVNRSYFAGEFDPTFVSAHESWKLWITYGRSTFWYFYIRSMLG
ncbi:MAG: metallophosphoesterase [Blautia sp.]|nr:metallophosphoesterase [Blautia sp.]